jgi:hypothetical protein
VIFIEKANMSIGQFSFLQVCLTKSIYLILYLDLNTLLCENINHPAYGIPVLPGK